MRKTNQVYIFGYIYYNYHYFGVSKYSINLFKLSILGSHFRPPVTFALRADLYFVKMPRQISLVVVTVRSKASCSCGFFFRISTIPLRICKLLNHKHLKRLDPLQYHREYEFFGICNDLPSKQNVHPGQ